MPDNNIYYIGENRKYKSITRLFLDLKDDSTEKTIFIDAGEYDIFKEYREEGIPSPPDEVSISDYFQYNAFLPINTKLIGIGNVLLKFSPRSDEISYGESITWSPLNILGECYIENIEIYCKNGRYCIHDDSHNKFQNSVHYYKNVRCTYEHGDYICDRFLGVNHTIGNGMAQGCKFEFEDCTFKFIGGDDNASFYTHECGTDNPNNAPSLIFKNCLFLGSEKCDKTLMLQNLAGADLQVRTRIESCYLSGGIYLTLYSKDSAQHYDVTIINSGNPPKKIDREPENKYPIIVFP